MRGEEVVLVDPLSFPSDLFPPSSPLSSLLPFPFLYPTLCIFFYIHTPEYIIAILNFEFPTDQAAG